MRENQLHAARIVLAVLRGESLTQKLQTLWQREQRLNAEDRGAIQDLCYGSLRHLSELQAYAESILDRPLSDELLRALLCVSLYQLTYSRNAAHTVVNEAVAAVDLLGRGRAKGLVNAVLRRYLREKDVLAKTLEGRPAQRYAYPQWWVDRLMSDYGPAYLSLLQAGNQHPNMALRVNRRRLTREAYQWQLTQQGMHAEAIGVDGLLLQRPVPVERLPGFQAGLVSVQDYGAQLAPDLLDIQEGMRVCDACAAPGGKTAHILERHDVEMTALEQQEERMASLAGTLNRLGLRARQYCVDAADLAAWWDKRPFQRVLLDGPCSASGVVRRHPDSKWLRRARDIDSFVVQQRRLLEALWQVVEPGGKLLYVTCSIFKAENEDVIAQFLRSHGDAQLQPARAPLDSHGRLMISAAHDGFFYAALHKRD